MFTNQPNQARFSQEVDRWILKARFHYFGMKKNMEINHDFSLFNKI